jgi:hypothetical protein
MMLTPERLAGMLDRQGLLGRARVVEVRERARHRSLFSERTMYDVAYQGTPDTRCPRHVLLKTALPGVAVSREMLGAEARHYRAFGQDEALPLVRCFDAADGDHPYVLLEDLSATHETPAGPLPASRRQTESMIDALARFHARWWEHPELGVSVAERWTPETVTRTAAAIRQQYARFRDLVGDALSPERAAVYERALAAWVGLARRLVGTSKLTLIHGDAHAWNCLFPRDPARHRAYLVDLATCRIRTPANDLAYMMAVMWFPDLRARWERPLLRRHLEQLSAAGVANYSWDDLWSDYRFAVLIHLFTPVHQAAEGDVPPSTWWYNLERVHAAFRDLDCGELL